MPTDIWKEECQNRAAFAGQSARKQKEQHQRKGENEMTRLEQLAKYEMVLHDACGYDRCKARCIVGGRFCFTSKLEFVWELIRENWHISEHTKRIQIQDIVAETHRYVNAELERGVLFADATV